MTGNFWLISAASGVAILFLGALAIFPHRGAKEPPLTEEDARAELRAAFDGFSQEPILVDAAAHAALARFGDKALLVWRLGDYVTSRSLAFEQLALARRQDDKVLIPLDDPAAPFARFTLAPGAAWPPSL